MLVVKCQRNIPFFTAENLAFHINRTTYHVSALLKMSNKSLYGKQYSATEASLEVEAGLWCLIHRVEHPVGVDLVMDITVRRP